MRAPWLGDVLRDAGLTVLTPAGNPIGRGRAMNTIYGVVGHDTVTTTAWTDARVDALIRDGRSDLPGPLYQLGLDREGRFRWIADGRSNHNGFGTWGNDSIGISAYVAGGLSGREERWNAKQQESFVIGARAILDYLSLGRSSYWNPRVAGHKETDRSRKPDPWGIDMNAIRQRVSKAHEQQKPEDIPDARTDFERWWDSMNKDQQKVLEDFADEIIAQGKKHGTKGNSIKWLFIDYRRRREAGLAIQEYGDIKNEPYSRLGAMLSAFDDMDTEPRGLAWFGIAAIRTLRAMGVPLDAKLRDTVNENKAYTRADIENAGVTLPRFADDEN